MVAILFGKLGGLGGGGVGVGVVLGCAMVGWQELLARYARYVAVALLEGFLFATACRKYGASAYY